MVAPLRFQEALAHSRPEPFRGLAIEVEEGPINRLAPEAGMQFYDIQIRGLRDRRTGLFLERRRNVHTC